MPQSVNEHMPQLAPIGELRPRVQGLEVAPEVVPPHLEEDIEALCRRSKTDCHGLGRIRGDRFQEPWLKAGSGFGQEVVLRGSRRAGKRYLDEEAVISQLDTPPGSPTPSRRHPESSQLVSSEDCPLCLLTNHHVKANHGMWPPAVQLWQRIGAGRMYP